MGSWTLLQWIGVVGVLAAIIGVWFAYKASKTPKATSETNIKVTGSPDAKVAGRDLNTGEQNSDVHKATINVKDSEGAEVAGRDGRQE